MQAFKFFSLHVFLPVTPVYSHPAPFRDLFIALLLFMQTRQHIYLSAFPVLAPLFLQSTVHIPKAILPSVFFSEYQNSAQPLHNSNT